MKKNGPKITLNHFTFFVNIFYPFNCDKPIPYHLTERTKGNIRAKQELLLEETTNALVNFMPHPRSSLHPRWGFGIASCPHPWEN